MEEKQPNIHLRQKEKKKKNKSEDAKKPPKLIDIEWIWKWEQS